MMLKNFLNKINGEYVVLFFERCDIKNLRVYFIGMLFIELVNKILL